MRKVILVPLVAVLALAGFIVYKRTGGSEASSAAGASGGGPGAGGRLGGARPPMPVEFAVVDRASVAEQVLVVGNLIGAATVEVVPKVNGRLQSVNVKLGDTVRRGQLIAKVEDLEIEQQVRQAEASHKVGEATIRQRAADLKLATSNLERNKSLLDRQLLPVQTYEDTQARYEAARAQLDLAEAQFDQAKSRLDELKITLANTSILSPVDGFVGKRFLDPGSFAGTNSPVASVVDIRTVRLVANLVEKDAKRVRQGTPAAVEVDAYPGETFTGTVSRVAPVFDPATRTAEMEIEVPNTSFRLKPGMYARVNLTVETRENVLTVPRNALVEVDGKTGVYLVEGGPSGGRAARGDGASPAVPAADTASRGRGTQARLVARFVPVETGIRAGDKVEVLSGLKDGARVITMGAGALRDGDPVVPAADGEGSGRRGIEGPGAGPGPGRGSGQGPGHGSEQAQRESRPEGSTR
jgi:RND family efflux transporter MFP subunit